MNIMDSNIAKCCSEDYLSENDIPTTANGVKKDDDSCTVDTFNYEVSGYDDQNISCVDYTMQKVCKFCFYLSSIVH